MAVLDTRIVKANHIGESAGDTHVSWWCGTCNRKFISTANSVMLTRKTKMGDKISVQLVLRCEHCNTTYLFEGRETKEKKARLRFVKVVYHIGCMRQINVEVPQEVVEYAAELKEQAERKAMENNYRKIRM